MSPYPADPVDATGPMRLVLVSAPRASAASLARDAVRLRFAACVQLIDIRSIYWWRGRREESEETLLLFKTVPKRVGGLFRYVARRHPYEVPEIVELDVPRVHPPYLAYLTAALGAPAIPPPRRTPRRGPRRRGSPQGPGARSPGRTRGRPRPR